MRKKIETIDLTPTWSGILPTMLLVYRDGSNEGRKEIEKEFKHLARVADQYVIIQKQGTQVRYSAEFAKYLDLESIGYEFVKPIDSTIPLIRFVEPIDDADLFELGQLFNAWKDRNNVVNLFNNE